MKPDLSRMRIPELPRHWRRYVIELRPVSEKFQIGTHAAEGGKARAKNLTAKQRLASALNANKERWKTEAQRKAHSEALKAAHARRRANAAKAGS